MTINPALIAARARRETLARVRAELARELRGAPHNAPAQSQLTYVGGLARARRLVETRYRSALTAEEQIVMAGVDPDLMLAAVKAAWDRCKAACSTAVLCPGATQRPSTRRSAGS